MEKKKDLDTKRIQFLGDGIFAVAITILILQLKVPEGLNHLHLLRFLADELFFHLLSVILSFIIIGAYWIDSHFHHHLITKTDKASTWLNFAFFLFICLIPFSTDFLARYHHDPLSVIVYGINLIGASMAHYFMLRHSWRKNFIRPHISSAIYRNMKFRIIFPVLVYSGIIVLSLFAFNGWIFFLFPAPLIFQIIFGRGKSELEV